jgi:uroporphyrinogen decarboxylase
MLSSREKVMKIFNRENTSGSAFWTGHPNDRTIPLYAEEWGIPPSREAIYEYLNDDVRWLLGDGYYRHPDGIGALDPSYGTTRDTLSAGGCFRDAETIAEIESYPWPDAKYFDFTEIYGEIDKFPDKMVFTGLWSSFFHCAADFFGMENYFVKMYEAPKLVDAVTEKITDFYVAANEKFFAGLGNRADVFSMGNDFGTQLDLIISPEKFRRFILPSIKRIVDVGKKYGKKVMLHSCGSIYRIIPDLIDAGIEILHPIQAQATGMSATDLAKYKNDLAFVGGIDAQSFLVDASLEQIEAEVYRVREILGPNIVISPSHEEILPNVPARNMLVMSKAALANIREGFR